MDDARLADLYPEYLFAFHCILRANVPLMEAALGQSESLAADDPTAAGLAAYLERHIPEELHHDEWLLADLELLGGERATILARAPSPAVAALVGAQYYWIFHYHPAALLGYIAALEGYPPSMQLIDELVARTGHSRAAFRTLTAHAELDPAHRDDLDEMLDDLPLTRSQSAVIGLSALYSVHMLTRVFEEIVDGSQQARDGGNGLEPPTS